MMGDIDEARYSRNLGLFGLEGQRKLQGAQVGVVGVGGLGSHVVQQLAYLGVREFVLVDPDSIEVSNLNRLVGAGPTDIGVRKVNLAQRLIHYIQPTAGIQIFSGSLQEEERAALSVVDCLFGCVDNDAARLLLTELTSTHRIPYFDLASDSGRDGDFLWYGGRVFVSVDGNHCLSCAGELDQRALALASMDVAQREADARIYGIDPANLDGTGPMVVSINGVVASLGVTEFLAWIVGLRQPRPHLVYRGDMGTVTIRNDKRSACYYCDVLWRGQR